ncbi:MAG: alanine--tRNA ligase [Coriobacteriia bacterium]|nr:alanine--tRNA ligase [Coriobacteriia bacterium]
MKSSELREKYLAFFETKGCKRLPSSSLIPDDPSLLLTSAGMVQFKPYYLQQKQLEAPYVGTATVQKCVRTTDIDIIGTTGRHLSFFEMLGNFSFGAYFKEEMCAWAYEFSTEILGFDPKRLYFTVYRDDDETVEIWKSLGVPDDHIRRLGEKDNFWRAGPTGPCGPCTELYFDQGPEYGCAHPDCGPGCDCERFLEYWNCVFTQYDSQEDGSLKPLPKKNIDTGMGLERTVTILQGVQSNYDTDILRGLIAVGERLSGLAYTGMDGGAADLSLRIIADHARAVTFMIADGILPSNEGRGYVLRRLLRRAMRHGQLLDIDPPFLGEFINVVIEEMGSVYPELVENRGLITRIVKTEEERFAQTLRQGQTYLDAALDSLSSGAGASSLPGADALAPALPGADAPAPALPGTDAMAPALPGTDAPPTLLLDGAVAFELHDRFGFPIDLTIEIAAEQGVAVDLDGFKVCMAAQRERARAHVKDDAWGAYIGVYNEVLQEQGASRFVGYAQHEQQAQVRAIIVNGELVATIRDGQAAQVILDLTPFYGEMGGQVGDTGLLLTEDGSRFTVQDTKVFEKALYAHIGHIDGALSVGDTVSARIDSARRERIQRNHTATHLLHYALRQVLGDHVKQAGSMVAPDRLRFDFTHFEPVTQTQLAQIEALTNTLIMEDGKVVSYETSLEAARASGVIALFGEKYDGQVRVLEAGAQSRELCGGTHVSQTAQIGFVKIISESSVGANLRRIEAVTSYDALAYVNQEEDQLHAAYTILKATPIEFIEKLNALCERNHEFEAALEKIKQARLAHESLTLVSAAIMVGKQTAQTAGAKDGSEAIVGDVGGEAGSDVGGDVGGDTGVGDGGSDTYRLVIARIDGLEIEDMRVLWDKARERFGEAGAVVLGTIRENGEPLILAAATTRAVEIGFNAGAVIKQIAPLIAGGGGGRPTMAQAGGSDAQGLDRALEAARQMLFVQE